MDCRLIACPSCRGVYWGKWERAFINGDPVYVDDDGSLATYSLNKRRPVAASVVPAIADERCPSCEEAAS